jgi:hypothetical protein
MAVPNQDGLESAKPDLQSIFKNPRQRCADPSSMGNASRRESADLAQAEGEEPLNGAD